LTKVGPILLAAVHHGIVIGRPSTIINGQMKLVLGCQRCMLCLGIVNECLQEILSSERFRSFGHHLESDKTSPKFVLDDSDVCSVPHLVSYDRKVAALLVRYAVYQMLYSHGDEARRKKAAGYECCAD
jgi:hypothetical protein